MAGANQPSLSGSGISTDVARPVVSSAWDHASSAHGNAFDDASPLAVFDFSLRGYSHKTGGAIILAGIFFGLAGLFVYLSFTPRGAGSTVPIVITTGLGIAFFVFPFAKYGKRIRRVEVFANGVRWHGPEGAGWLFWRNVEAVYRSELVLNGLRQSEIKLVGGGREVTFDLTLDRYPEMAGLIQELCARSMRPRKREEAGSCGAEFGPLLVGPAGISIEGWLVSWDSVTRYVVKGGWLWFHFMGNGRKGIPLHTIPNYLLLLYLMGEFAPPAVRQASGLPVSGG
jgi:hypothetical protein